jgi:16S rRNA (guanine966-N2)-methyltransferase
MRIIAGKYKGKNISAGNSLSIRPVTTKIKESIFNILGEFVLEKDIIDLFSGSGSFYKFRAKNIISFN